MTTLYIRLPAHPSVASLQPGAPLVCPFAQVSSANRVEREGVAPLAEMGELVRHARAVVLLLAASDVTLLRVKMPPLTGARLRAALPNLVEDELMSDPSECVVVAGEMTDGLRTVAVVQRDWLELLSRTLRTLGARKLAALPAQLCLPMPEDASVAAVAEHGVDVDLTLRRGPQEGIGVAMVADQAETAAFEVMQSLHALVPQGNLVLHVPQPRLRDYQASLHLVPELEQRVSLQAESWAVWINGAQTAGVDLMSGLAATGSQKLDLRRWRWPLALAAGVLLVNVIALNIEWLRMQRESASLRASMMQNYRAAFPKDTVILDPLAQARQKLAATRNAGGELAPGDFLALTARLAEAWASTGQEGVPPIASLDYRDQTLTLRMKPQAEIEPDALQSALAARNLTVAEQEDGVWQVRSAR